MNGLLTDKHLCNGSTGYISEFNLYLCFAMSTPPWKKPKRAPPPPPPPPPSDSSMPTALSSVTDTKDLPPWKLLHRRAPPPAPLSHGGHHAPDKLTPGSALHPPSTPPHASSQPPPSAFHGRREAALTESSSPDRQITSSLSQALLPFVQAYPPHEASVDSDPLPALTLPPPAVPSSPTLTPPPAPPARHPGSSVSLHPLGAKGYDPIPPGSSSIPRLPTSTEPPTSPQTDLTLTPPATGATPPPPSRGGSSRTSANVTLRTHGRRSRFSSTLKTRGRISRIRATLRTME